MTIAELRAGYLAPRPTQASVSADEYYDRMLAQVLLLSAKTPAEKAEIERRRLDGTIRTTNDTLTWTEQQRLAVLRATTSKPSQAVPEAEPLAFPDEPEEPIPPCFQARVKQIEVD